MSSDVSACESSGYKMWVRMNLPTGSVGKITNSLPRALLLHSSLVILFIQSISKHSRSCVVMDVCFQRTSYKTRIAIFG